MAKVEGCWANVLDDCSGDLTGEHLLSVSIWEPPAGSPDNRESKLQREIKLSGRDEGAAETMPLADLTTKVLCLHHNNSTHGFDVAAGNFRRAFLEYIAVINHRKDHRVRCPRPQWS